MEKKMEVGVLGATGMVGQQFIAQLADHPWFKVVWVAASERSEGRKYDDIAQWRLPRSIPETIAGLIVDSCTPGRAPRLVFSALDASVAGEIETAFAAAGHVVVSNARNHRLDETVPLLVPEINAEHLSLLPAQRRAKGWSGAIVTNPNCSTVILTMALAPLRVFGLKAALVTTLQAVSGAGYPGVPSLDALGNVVPFIAGEEEKIERETKKILGQSYGERVEPHEVLVSAHTNRVPVENGHTETVSVALQTKPSPEEVVEAFRRFSGRPQERGLPSAPPHPVVYLDAQNRPQPRLDANRDGGMTVSVGRVRRCPVLDYKFVVLGHNTIRGAAGAAALNAELMVAEGLL